MSFDVFLITSSASPEGEAARTATDRALALCGARRAHPDQDLILSTGEDVEFYGANDEDAGGMFALRGELSPELALVMFEIADATHCFIVSTDGARTFLRTPSNTAEPPEGSDADDGDEPWTVEPVADSTELAQRLVGGVATWSDYRDHLFEPPSPTDEPDSLLGRFWNRLTKRR